MSGVHRVDIYGIERHSLLMCFAIAVTRICRIHEDSSVSLGMVRGTDRKTLLL